MPLLKNGSARVLDLYMAKCFEDLQDIAAKPPKTEKQTASPAVLAERLLKSLKTLEQAMNAARLNDDEERYYVLAYRYFETFRELRKKEQFLKDKIWFERLTSLDKVVEDLERLQKSLEKRYEKLSTPAEVTSNTVIPGKDLLTKADGDSGRSSSGSHHAKNGRPETTASRNGSHSAPMCYISSSDLSNLLKKSSGSVLIMDLRDSADFDSSHIICENIINIPFDRLEKPVIKSSVDKCLDQDVPALAKWRNSYSFETVVIVNELGKEATAVTDVVNFISIITEYSTKPCKNVRILDSGFYDFFERYPQIVTDSHYVIPKNTSSSTELDLDRMERTNFPRSVNLFPPPPASCTRNAIFQEISSISARQTGVIFSGFIEDSEELSEPKSAASDRVLDNTFAPETKSDVNSKSMPSINRALKPMQAPKNHPEVEKKVEINIGPKVTVTRGSQLDDEPEVLSNEVDVIVFNGREKLPENPVFDLSEPVPVKEMLEPKKSRPNSGIFGGESRPEVVPSKTKDFPNGPANIIPPVTKPVPIPPKPSHTLSSHSNHPVPVKVIPDPKQNIEDRKPASSRENLPQNNLQKPYPPFPVEVRKADENQPPLPNSTGVRNPNIIPAASQKPLPVIPMVDRVTKPTPIPVTLPDYPPISEWQPFQAGKVVSGLTGLVNLGNTCYMNAMLQCLAFSVPIRNYYLSKSYRNDVNPRNPRGSKGLVSVYMEQLMQLIWSGEYKYIAPKFMKKVLAYLHEMFRGSDQQDAHSALVIFVEFLLEDTNRARLSDKSDQERGLATRIQNSESMSPSVLATETLDRHKLITLSVLDNCLAFMTESVIACSHCRYESCTFHMDQMLNLWLGDGRGNSAIDLSDLLNTLMEPSGQDAVIQDWKCPKCRQNRRAFQRHFFHSTPKLLIVLLKRFKGDCMTKDERVVSFPEEISVEAHCRNRGTGKSNYRVYAVLDHYGRLDSGHYTATVRHPETHDWIKFDDQTVTTGIKYIVSEKAYILFYERCD